MPPNQRAACPVIGTGHVPRGHPSGGGDAPLLVKDTVMATLTQGGSGTAAGQPRLGVTLGSLTFVSLSPLFISQPPPRVMPEDMK